MGNSARKHRPWYGSELAYGPIQKHIHQIWIQGEQYPERYTPFTDSVKQHHPEYGYTLWTQTKFEAEVLSHYSDFLPVWKLLDRMIYRVDVMKIFILFMHGGILVDIDVQVRKVPQVNVMLTFTEVPKEHGPAH